MTPACPPYDSCLREACLRRLACGKQALGRQALWRSEVGRRARLLLILLLLAGGAQILNCYAQTSESKEQAKKLLRSKPIHFLENKGQIMDAEGNPVPSVLFKAESPNADLYITDKGVTFLFFEINDGEGEREEKPNEVKYAKVDMELSGAKIKKENIVKENPSATDFNFFFTHCPDGIYGVKEYEEFTVKEIYPGIDWRWYNNKNGIKHEFIVHPGADASRIKWSYKWQKSVNKNEKGELVIEAPLGEYKESKPFCFEKNSGKEISCDYQIQRSGVHFDLDTYNHEDTLVIDPGMDLQW